MPILQRALLRELFQNALVTFAVITLIFLVGGSLRFLHEAEIVTLDTFLRGVVFFVGTSLEQTLPMTVLVSTVVTFGRAAADNEINALRAAGVHLYRAWLPAVLFGLLSAALVLHVNDRIAPRLEAGKERMVEAGLDSAIRALLERGGQALEISDELQVVWAGVDEADRLREVRIKRYAEDDEGVLRLRDEIFAESARLEADERRGLLKIQCEGVRVLHGQGAEGSAGRATYVVPLRDEWPEKKLSHHTLSELFAAVGRRYEGAPKARKVRVEIHRRVAGAFSCLLFVLLGWPLSILFRHGNRMVAFLIAFLIALVVYYPTFLLGEVLAEETHLGPFLAMWCGSLVLAAFAVALTALVFRR